MRLVGLRSGRQASISGIKYERSLARPLPQPLHSLRTVRLTRSREACSVFFYGRALR